MAALPDPVEASARLDDLRRRLYRDGATKDDLRRYLGERGPLSEATAPDALTDSGPDSVPDARPGDRLGHRPEALPEGVSEALPEGVSDARPVTPRRAALIAVPIAVAVAALTAIAGVAATTVHARSVVAASPAASEGRSAAAPTGAGRGGTATTVQNGSTKPTRVPVSVDGVAAVAWQVEGHGSVYVPVDRAEASFRGGRAVVVLSAPDTVPIAWRAVRLLTRSNRSSNEQVVARSAAADRSGVPRTTVVDYDGDPPSHIAVRAQSGRGWTLLVALIPAVRSDLH